MLRAILAPICDVRSVTVLSSKRVRHPVPKLKETPSQTAGPYVHIGLTPNFADIKGVYPTDPGVVFVGGLALAGLIVLAVHRLGHIKH